MVLSDNYFKAENLAIDSYKVLDSNGKVVRKSLFSNPTEKLIFIAISRLSNNSDAFPGQAFLAEIVHCSKSQIEKSLRKLKAKGLVKVIKNPNRKTNTYELANLKEKYLEAFGPEYKPSKKGVHTVPGTKNKELYIKNNNKITNSKIIGKNLKELERSFEKICNEAKLKINKQTKINIMNLIESGCVTLERVKEVFRYVDKFKKNGGFLFSALKKEWILRWNNKKAPKDRILNENVLHSQIVKSIDEIIKNENREAGMKNKEIVLTKDEEREALKLARKKDISIFMLDVMKGKSKELYIRTLRNLLDSKDLDSQN